MTNSTLFLKNEGAGLGWVEIEKRLHMLLPPLTNKQKEILILFLRFRFLSRHHIQQFLNHKDKKTINYWLRDLVEKRYISKLQNSHFTFITQPTTYYLGINGVRFLRTLHIYSENYIKNLYRDDERSQSFKTVCFLVADICLALRANKAEGEYSYFTCQDLKQKDNLWSVINDLNPHLYFTENRDTCISGFLIEIFTHSLPYYKIRKRINQYIHFITKENWKENLSRSGSKVIFICPSKNIMLYVTHYIEYSLRKFKIEDFEYDIYLANNSGLVRVDF